VLDRTGTVVISAINGTAGVGKTTLAVRWSHQVADWSVPAFLDTDSSRDLTNFSVA
jgi:cellulose biosynthesis protein BcsQ